jgi:two-component sensor histidine kinase
VSGTVTTGKAASTAGLSPRIDAMHSISISSLAARSRDPWRGYAMRGVKTAAAAVLIAACLWAMSSQSFSVTLVYSLCISLMCWLFIDTSRGVIAGFWPVAVKGGDVSGGRWPGWLWMVAIVAVGAVLGYAAGNEIANWILAMHQTGPFNSSWRQTLSLLVVALVPAITITYFFQSREVMATQRAEVELAKRQASEQRLMLLESQLEPHMLFNTLANLRALIGVDPERAQEMLDHLIAFLRASLAGSRERLHPLGDEFARLADYLALMQIRMGPRLQTSFVLPVELAQVPVPPLLLQPLVENCIKHGLEPKVAGGRIDVSARREGDTLVVEVRDDGLGVAATAGAAAGSSFGLVHVRERMATLYGAAATFALGPAPHGAAGTCAVVRLPIQATPSGRAGQRPKGSES